VRRAYDGSRVPTSFVIARFSSASTRAWEGTIAASSAPHRSSVIVWRFEVGLGSSIRHNFRCGGSDVDPNARMFPVHKVRGTATSNESSRLSNHREMASMVMGCVARRSISQARKQDIWQGGM
jgi:hypothetical protein